MSSGDPIGDEAARIKADPDQMRLVVMCMMQFPEFLEMVLAIYTEAISRGIANGNPDPAQVLARAIEGHVTEHATATIRVYEALSLLRADALSPRRH
jgi:hypothetical protein